MYQIFVDRFCNGDPTNDVQSCEYVYIGRPVYQVNDWSRNPSTMDVGCFYRSSDLQGVCYNNKAGFILRALVTCSWLST